MTDELGWETTCPVCGRERSASTPLGDGFLRCVCGEEWNVTDHRRHETTTPRDGERLGVFEYHAARQVWVYTAGYHDPYDCERRAESLNLAFCPTAWPRWFYVDSIDGEYYAMANAYPDVTAALRAALTPTIWQDDSAAHVRETVDELRREGAGE